MRLPCLRGGPSAFFQPSQGDEIDCRFPAEAEPGPAGWLFQKGQSGNSSGRRPGCRNRPTLAAETLGFSHWRRAGHILWRRSRSQPAAGRRLQHLHQDRQFRSARRPRLDLHRISLGLGMASKVALAAVVVFFVVVGNAFQGVREADRNLIANTRILGASPRQVTTAVVIPSALSWIIASSPALLFSGGSRSPFALLKEIKEHCCPYRSLKPDGDVFNLEIIAHASEAALAPDAAFLHAAGRCLDS